LGGSESPATKDGNWIGHDPLIHPILDRFDHISGGTQVFSDSLHMLSILERNQISHSFGLSLDPDHFGPLGGSGVLEGRSRVRVIEGAGSFNGWFGLVILVHFEVVLFPEFLEIVDLHLHFGLSLLIFLTEAFDHEVFFAYDLSV
jgi:hypothetical protein